VFTTLTVEGILGAGKLFFFYPIKLCTFSLQNSVFLFCNKHQTTFLPFLFTQNLGLNLIR
ncbi:hypothetical protein, partial [Symbiobacterium thermophilum]|uniref:hypothetical protein n=1 Tax=Symbiobacterium thermophilum TaxID=2734 RepID=UPI0023574672